MVNTLANRRYAARGFTLLELLVVMALAAIIMGIVPRLISAAVPGANLRMHTHDLAANLREARNRAVATSGIVDVMIEYDPPRFVVGDREVQTMPERVVISARSGMPLQPGDWVRPAKRHPTEALRIRFFPDGSSSGASITLQRGSLAYTIGIDWLLGKVTIEPGVPNDGF